MTTIGFRRTGMAISGLVVAVGVLGGCHSAATPIQKEGAPSTSITPVGPNSYAPQVKAPAAPTALPGNVITGN